MCVVPMLAVEFLLAVQTTQATVRGTVRDAGTGAPIEGVEVMLTDLGRTTSTGADGRYRLADVSTGAQHIRVRSLGYAARTLHALVPSAGELEINVSLRPVSHSLTLIKVRPSVAVRGVEERDSAVFSRRSTSIAAVRNHPLLAEPDAFQALGGGEVVMALESPTGVHLRGGASDQTAYLLDGIPVLSPYHAGATFSAWNPDALARLDLSPALAELSDQAVLSGAVSGVTRTSGPRHTVQGSTSTTQSRFTIDGPFGEAGAGYLLSLRSAFPGTAGARREWSYLTGASGDLIAKVQLPTLGGNLQLLGYESQNEIGAAAAVGTEVGRNNFEWRSQSLGVQWSRQYAAAAIRASAWSALGEASAVWGLDSSRILMATTRRDAGFLASAQRDVDGRITTAGIRLDAIGTAYDVAFDSATNRSWRERGRTPFVSFFASRRQPIAGHAAAEIGGTAANFDGRVYLSPRAQMRWQPSDPLTLVLAFGRAHQFAQSLRNTESVVGNVFPADLYLGAGVRGVPVGRSDQGSISAELRAFPGVRFGAQAYARALDGLLLVAPREGEPFVTGAFAVGSGSSTGFTLDAALSTARVGLLGSYGFQRVWLEHGDSAYVPGHGTTHLAEAGLIALPTPTTSVRLGVTGALGRRTTIVAGGFEWEGCNLSDRGCEFVGSPHYRGQSLGRTPLPGYLRADLGVRKHWHFEVRGRDATIAAFGTVTNLLFRRNILTYASDPATGRVAPVEMRPRSPLVVGLDWRF